MDNFIFLNRCIQSNWLWEHKPFSEGQAWIDMLMLANWKDTKIPYKGEIIICKRGDVNMSLSKLAERWGWSRHKVSNFLNLLEGDKMISQNRTAKRTVITVENYDKYQSAGTVERTGAGQVWDRCGTGVGQVRDITNKDNKGNKENKDNKENNNIGGKPTSLKNIIPPTREMVLDYINEKGYSVDADMFIDFYESKNWYVGKNKMKDWQASLRTWNKNRNDKSKNNDWDFMNL